MVNHIIIGKSEVTMTNNSATLPSQVMIQYGVVGKLHVLHSLRYVVAR